ncbi:MAG: choice-of-anchor B family protein [bacterium]|nr:choice-of-anchor B family protein [bacterium]
MRIQERLSAVVLVMALLPVAPREAEACHLPDHLRKQEASLTKAQLALLAHGGSKRQQIAYEMEQLSSCSNGRADIFLCENIDLLAHFPLSEIGGGTGNDIWGWAEPQTGREYALVGRSNGTAFIDMTDPENPVFVGNLPTADNTSAWRDIKVYRNHAFVVADFAGEHGMQVFDLGQLRNARNLPVQFQESGHYFGFNRAHNLVINEDTGFAYAVGSETCSGGGLHMIDISDPLEPVFAGCFGDDGYTHDAQCVVYHGPDADHRGREICFASNEDTVTVVDVSDKDAPKMLSRTGYDDSGYTHQGWLTEDHAYFIHDDELDEQRFGHNTKTYVWDMSDLDDVKLAGAHFGGGRSIDHNQYVRGEYTYQANYRRGLRILELKNPAKGKLKEVAFFDTFPEADGDEFDGAWSVYPYLQSGAVVVSDINRGLFVLRPRLKSRIFADGFESGDLASWSKSKGDAVSVTTPGLDGSSHALSVSVANGARSFVGSDHPARERTLLVRFLLNPNKVDLGSNSVEILRLVAGKNRAVAQLLLEPAGSRYRLSLFGLAGDKDPVLIGSTRIARGKATEVGLEWRAATAAGERDGRVVLRKKKKQRRVAGAEDLDTGDLVIDAVRLGLPDGAPAGLSGGFLVDAYESSTP